MEIVAVPANRGWGWLVDSYELFRRGALTWLLMFLALFAFVVLCAQLGWFGSVLTALLLPVFNAGVLAGADALARQRDFRFGWLFAGFLKGAGHLVTIGGIYLVGQFAVLAIVGGIGGQTLAELAAQGGGKITPEAAGAATGTLLMAALLGIALLVPLLMAIWFAPMLVYFDDYGPLAAMRISLSACLRNLRPFVVYGATVLAFAVLASLLLQILRAVPGIGPMLASLGLGMVIGLFVPILFISPYPAYREVFVPGLPPPGPGADAGSDPDRPAA
jgi:hypothetical protein